jgi:hypothetical protein
VKIEWALACDGVQVGETGELLNMGRPIETTYLDVYSDRTPFSVPVVLTVLDDDDWDGVSVQRLAYVVHDDAEKIVGEGNGPVTALISREPGWPSTWPIRMTAAVTVDFIAARPGPYLISFYLDDQLQLQLGHLMLRESDVTSA